MTLQLTPTSILLSQVGWTCFNESVLGHGPMTVKDPSGQSVMGYYVHPQMLQSCLPQLSSWLQNPQQGFPNQLHELIGRKPHRYVVEVSEPIDALVSGALHFENQSPGLFIVADEMMEYQAVLQEETPAAARWTGLRRLLWGPAQLPLSLDWDSFPESMAAWSPRQKQIVQAIAEGVIKALQSVPTSQLLTFKELETLWWSLDSIQFIQMFNGVEDSLGIEVESEILFGTVGHESFADDLRSLVAVFLSA